MSPNFGTYKRLTRPTIATVLRNMATQCDEDVDDKARFREVYMHEIEGMLDKLLSEDFFGTEDRQDPRGGYRE